MHVYKYYHDYIVEGHVLGQSNGHADQSHRLMMLQLKGLPEELKGLPEEFQLFNTE